MNKFLRAFICPVIIAMSLRIISSYSFHPIREVIREVSVLAGNGRLGFGMWRSLWILIAGVNPQIRLVFSSAVHWLDLRWDWSVLIISSVIFTNICRSMIGAFENYLPVLGWMVADDGILSDRNKKEQPGLLIFAFPDKQKRKRLQLYIKLPERN